MSVPVWKRNIADKEWFRKSSELYSFTMKKVKNEKWFPKRYWKISTEKIVEDARDIKLTLVRAYFFKVDNEQDFIYRRTLQKQAYSLCVELLILLDNQYFQNKNIQDVSNDNNVNYWTSLIEETMKSIKDWMAKEKNYYHSKLNLG